MREGAGGCWSHSSTKPGHAGWLEPPPCWHCVAACLPASRLTCGGPRAEGCPVPVVVLRVQQEVGAHNGHAHLQGAEGVGQGWEHGRGQVGGSGMAEQGCRVVTGEQSGAPVAGQCVQK